MTYVVGWKTAENSFLCADMAITKVGSNLEKETREQSVFGERIVSTDNESVRDSLPKIIKINQNIILGFAGDVGLANTVIEDLKLRVEFLDITSESDLLRLLESSVANCLFGESTNQIQIILTSIIALKPVMVSYNHDNAMKSQVITDIVQIGSLTENPIYTASSHFISSVLAQGSLPLRRMLPCVTSFIQSFGVHDPIMEYYGVGGVITGALLGEAGVEWQDNTIYILYDDLSSVLELINVINNEGTILARDAKGNYQVFANKNNFIPYEEFTDEVIEEIKFDINTDSYKYVAFINKRHRQVVVLEREPLANNSKYFNLEIQNEVDLNINIEPELSAVLMKNRRQTKNAVPFSFEFLFDKEKGVDTEPFPIIKGSIGVGSV